jgi:hypothetical protein
MRAIASTPWANDRHQTPVSRQTLIAAATGLVPFVLIGGKLELAAALERLTLNLRVASNHDVEACEVRLAALLSVASDLFIPESGCA